MARRPSPPVNRCTWCAADRRSQARAAARLYHANRRPDALSSVGQKRIVTRSARVPAAVEVECYAGYRSEESPRRFRLAGQQIEIADEVDRWLAPDHRYFKVRDTQGDLFILRNDVVSGRWELTHFRDGRDRGAIPPIRDV